MPTLQPRPKPPGPAPQPPSAPPPTPRALAAENARLRAHNARMAAMLNVMADGLESRDTLFWVAVTSHLGLSPYDFASPALRALAAGEVDDG